MLKKIFENKWVQRTQIVLIIVTFFFAWPLFGAVVFAKIGGATLICNAIGMIAEYTG